MTKLHGKGIWVLYSANLTLALEMAGEIGATHVLYKTGHRAMFFPRSARQVHDRVRAAGLIPFAWHFIYCDDPAGEARVVMQTVKAGYEGIVFDVGAQTAGQHTNAKELGRRLLDAGLDAYTLYYSSFPNISRHASIPYAEMNAFCKGGFMPQSYPTFLKPAEVVIHKMTYEEHAKWSKAWGYSMPIYPVLACYRDEHAADQLTPGEFAHWARVLAEHAPPFFSVFRASVTKRDFWPSLADLAVVQPPVTAQPPVIVAAEPVALPEPEPLETTVSDPSLESEGEDVVYIVVQADDVVWKLRQEYDCTRKQFWEWNGYLWDEQGLPRDPDYMQVGWRVRLR